NSGAGTHEQGVQLRTHLSELLGLRLGGERLKHTTAAEIASVAVEPPDVAWIWATVVTTGGVMRVLITSGVDGGERVKIRPSVDIMYKWPLVFGRMLAAVLFLAAIHFLFLPWPFAHSAPKNREYAIPRKKFCWQFCRSRSVFVYATDAG